MNSDIKIRKEFTLPAKQLSAALNFVSKKDSRRYLTGVHINPDQNRIEATDGQILFSAYSLYPLDGVSDMILLIDGSIPKGADLARFFIVENQHQQIDFCEEPSGYIWFEDESGNPLTKQNGIKESILFKVIEGDYPHIDNVLPRGNTYSVDSISIDPSIMGKISKACNAINVVGGIPFEFFGHTSAVRIHLGPERAMADTTMLIMPCRQEKETEIEPKPDSVALEEDNESLFDEEAEGVS